MNSYQKLKAKCEYLQSQLNLFKDCLVVAKKDPELISTEETPTGTLYNFRQLAAVQCAKKLQEYKKLELTRWVAQNLDIPSIKNLLKIREELEND